MFDYTYESLDKDRLMKYRLDVAQRLMREKELDALVIAEAVNVRYLSDIRGYASPELHHNVNMIVINRDGEYYLYTQLFKTIAKKMYPWVKDAFDIPAWCRFTTQEDAIAGLVIDGLSKAGVAEGKIGIDLLPFQVVDLVREKSPKYKLVSCYTDLIRMRMIKTPDEIEMMKLAAANNDIGMQAAYEACVVGNSEFDVVAACIGAIAKAGAEGLTHYPGVRSGERTLYDFRPVGRKLRNGDPVIIDCGNYAEGGYACDFCRTWFVNKPSDKMRKCFDVVHEAQMAAVEFMKPGVLTSEVHEKVNAVMNKHGFPSSIYANGHGVGMAMVEIPAIESKELLTEDLRLEEGMTFCVEPISTTDEGGVKIEDVILVTKNGGQLLTKAPYFGK